jgi:hypothetical protein
MGLIARSVTSKRFPFSQLSKNVKKMEQIKMVAMKYGVENQLHLHRNRRDWSVLGAHEEMLQLPWGPWARKVLVGAVGLRGAAE